MSKTVDVSELFRRMKENAKTGLEGGVWFATIPANIGKAFMGELRRIFSYEVNKEERYAFSVRLHEAVTFEMIINAENTETVTLNPGETLLVNLDGLLRWKFEECGVGPGTIVFLQYEGKDKTVTRRGQHPHQWTYSFMNPDTGEILA